MRAQPEYTPEVASKANAAGSKGREEDTGHLELERDGASNSVHDLQQRLQESFVSDARENGSGRRQRGVAEAVVVTAALVPFALAMFVLSSGYAAVSHKLRGAVS